MTSPVINKSAYLDALGIQQWALRDSESEELQETADLADQPSQPVSEVRVPA